MSLFSTDPKITVSYVDKPQYGMVYYTLELNVVGGNKDSRTQLFNTMKAKISSKDFDGQIQHAMNIAAGDGIARDYASSNTYWPALHKYELGYTSRSVPFLADKMDAIKEAMVNKACELLGAEKAASQGKNL